MKIKTLYLAAATIGSVAIFQACKAKKVTADECSGVAVSYATAVKPIIDDNCAKTCHSAAKKAGKIDLSTYESVKAISTEARFLGAIRHLAGFDAMPMKAPKLSDSSIRVISCWVKNGTPE
jgi:hypothetical protein